MGYDPAPQRGPDSIDERILAGAVFVVGFGFFVAEVATNYHPGKLVGLLFLLSWAPLIALHEAGHAVAAWLVGWHVDQVVVGFGKPVYSGRVGTATVEVRLYPIMGFVTSRPGRAGYSRVADAFIYFAGPGVELALFALLALLFGPDRYFAASADPLLIAGQSVGLAAVVGAVLNLIPGSATINGRAVPNDGMGIIRALAGLGGR